MTVRRRGIVRRTAQTYVDLCHERDHFPTTAEIEAAVRSAASFTMEQFITVWHRWVKRDVLAMMEERDPSTRARRYLLLPDTNGALRWHPHDQLTFSSFADATRFVTRPQADRQSRAERRRDIERQVLDAMESHLGRAVTVAEAWPEVLQALEAQGLGL